MLTSELNKQKAYKYCMAIAKNHYENFPVASYLLSKHLRIPISVVYAFARTADDFADEGDLSKQERLKLLDEYIVELEQIEAFIKAQAFPNSQTTSYSSQHLIFIALAEIIHNFKIPIALFYDLINAFKQDVNTKRYKSFDDILEYCRLSANPVGRILLYLNNSVTSQNLADSDAICTGLQLINFYQDIGQDIGENDRLYLTLDELEHYHVAINDIREQIDNKNTQALIKFQLQRTRKLYVPGVRLCSNLSGRFAIEIKMIYAGGLLVLDKLEQNTSSIYLRPRLTRRDKFKILWQVFFPSINA